MTNNIKKDEIEKILEKIDNDVRNSYSKYVQIIIPSFTYFEFAKKLCEKYNYKSEDTLWRDFIYPLKLVIYIDRKEYHYNFIECTAQPTIEFTQLEELLQNLSKNRNVITIGTDKVHFFLDGSIKVGCQNIPYSIVEKIYKRATQEVDPGK